MIEVLGFWTSALAMLFGARFGAKAEVLVIFPEVVSELAEDLLKIAEVF